MNRLRLLGAMLGMWLVVSSVLGVPTAMAEQEVPSQTESQGTHSEEDKSEEANATASQSLLQPGDLTVVAQIKNPARAKRSSSGGPTGGRTRNPITNDSGPPEFQFLTGLTPEQCLAVGSLPLSLDDTAATILCVKPPTTPDDTTAPAPPSREQVEALVRTLAARLRVPEPTIHVGPDPSVNEWNMAVVGLPLWLWTDAPRTMSTAASGSGISITIDAAIDSIMYTMGDGNQVRCANWTPRPRVVNPVDAPSPTCGHTYSWPSLPKGDYTITATARWTAQWSALGYSGTVPLTSTATRDLPVGELQAVVVRR